MTNALKETLETKDTGTKIIGAKKTVVHKVKKLLGCLFVVFMIIIVGNLKYKLAS